MADRRGTRVLIASAILALVAVLLATAGQDEAAPVRSALGALPPEMGAWRGQERSLAPEVVEAAGMDDYLNRVYRGAPGTPDVEVYVGYYVTQRTGNTIHSPRNCLPGAGWEPVYSARPELALATGESVRVNEYVIQRASDRRLVLYWYQSNGRVSASEYEAKLWLVWNAIRWNRTDGALVRLITSTQDGEAAARARAMEFAGSFHAQLRGSIP